MHTVHTAKLTHLIRQKLQVKVELEPLLRVTAHTKEALRVMEVREQVKRLLRSRVRDRNSYYNALSVQRNKKESSEDEPPKRLSLNSNI